MKKQKRVIDQEEALALMEKAVLERGEKWCYPHLLVGECAYFMDDEETFDSVFVNYGLKPNGPSCLVGLALSYVGLTKEIISYHNTEGVTSINDAIEGNDDIDWVLGADAIKVFYKAQEYQDDGAKWGDVLRIVKEEAQDS